jgi:hypothetical protein
MRSLSFHSKSTMLALGSPSLSACRRNLTRMKGSTGPPQVFLPYMPFRNLIRFYIGVEGRSGGYEPAQYWRFSSDWSCEERMSVHGALSTQMWCSSSIPCQSPWPGQSRRTSPGGIAPLEGSCFRRSAGSAVNIVSYRWLWFDGVAEDVGDGANKRDADGHSGVAAWKCRDARAELYWTMSLLRRWLTAAGGSACGGGDS